MLPWEHKDIGAVEPYFMKKILFDVMLVSLSFHC